MAEAMSQHRKAAFSLARHSTGIIASVLFLGPIVWTV
ncbi:MAG: carbohydrate ABC transporter permease, partial [Mesorhizobium sp.]